DYYCQVWDSGSKDALF
nr:immunoglobulin light chain junction region [Macaca mulatta]MOW06380.1 immunoglobulin light chain junction region [Macaca mulatta]MOW07041.1 immunoglobulin light chain junction region [Macaca mulatta]